MSVLIAHGKNTFFLIFSLPCIFLWVFSSSGSVILLKITLTLRMILQNISRRVVVCVLMNISSSNTLLILLLTEIYNQKCQTVVGCYGHEWVNYEVNFSSVRNRHR